MATWNHGGEQRGEELRKKKKGWRDEKMGGKGDAGGQSNEKVTPLVFGPLCSVL